MSNTPDAFVYNATLERIVDGDTFDCCLDLGFDVKLHKQRVMTYIHWDDWKYLNKILGEKPKPNDKE